MYFDPVFLCRFLQTMPYHKGLATHQLVVDVLPMLAQGFDAIGLVGSVFKKRILCKVRVGLAELLHNLLSCMDEI